MTARLDHLVIAVPDLPAAIQRWTAAGLPATPGGRHPGGTVNALVRGPEPAYLELISASAIDAPGVPAVRRTGNASDGWADRVRHSAGPLSWAVAVDDLDRARQALLAGGFSPAEIVDGSRQTPSGTTLRWRLCQVGEQPFDSVLPFLIQWVTPMPAGPADGPLLRSVVVGSSNPRRLTRMLELAGLPRDRSFEEGTVIGGSYSGDPWLQFGDPGTAAVFVVTGDDRVQSASFGLAHQTQVVTLDNLDGLELHTAPDLRAHRLYPLVQAMRERFAARCDPTPTWPAPHPHRSPLEEEYSRCTAPQRYRILTERAEAWVQTLLDLGLGHREPAQPSELPGFSAAESYTRVTRVRPTVPEACSLLIGVRGFEGQPDNAVAIGASSPEADASNSSNSSSVSLTARALPDCGCDACDDGSQPLLDALDEAVLTVLDGGVLSVQRGGNSVTRTFDGWSASGGLTDGEVERWLAGHYPVGSTVVAGSPWW